MRGQRVQTAAETMQGQAADALDKVCSEDLEFSKLEIEKPLRELGYAAGVRSRMADALDELLTCGLDFSKLESVEQVLASTFQFDVEFAAVRKSRERGFLHIEVGGISDLVDRTEEESEELYLAFQVKTAAELKIHAVAEKPKSLVDYVVALAFGETRAGDERTVNEEDQWDGWTQEHMRELYALDLQLASTRPDSPEHEQLRQQISQGETRLRAGPFSGRIFSSVALRDPSPDAQIRLPGDRFRLFIDCTDSETKYVVCTLFRRPLGLTSSSRATLVGQAKFELRGLLHVLHDDAEQTDDHATFVNGLERETGSISVRFQYKCATLQDEPTASMLPQLVVPLPQSADQLIDTSAGGYEYPRESDLQVCWRADTLKLGDRLLLVRGDKLSSPYFLMLWKEIEQPNDTKEDEECEEFDWWIPASLHACYGDNSDQFTSTDAHKRSGTVRFPSALRLMLPPGAFRIYLVRNEVNESGKTFSVLLGVSPILGVLPGVNSAHALFGTTPLLDVRPFKASLQLFPGNKMSTRPAENDEEGALNSQTLACLELELEMMKMDTASSGDRDQRGFLPQRNLRDMESELENMKRLLCEREFDPSDAGEIVNPEVTSTDPIVFSYRFFGGSTQPGDRIVVLPAEIVQVSDVLRATILSKLQARDPEEAGRASVLLEEELNKAINLYNAEDPIKLLVLTARKVWRWIGFGGELNEIEDVCLRAYTVASTIVRRHFGLVLQDLTEEIIARGHLLGLNVEARKRPKERLLMMVGKEIPADVQVVETISEPDSQIFQTRAVLGPNFADGGHFVAKYVRWGDIDSVDAAGELCRHGPFYVQPSVSPTPMLLKLWNARRLIVRAARSELAVMLLQVGYRACLGLIKYALVVANLSFNLLVLARVFTSDVTKIKEVMEKYQNLFWTPIGALLQAFNTLTERLVSLITYHFDLFHVSGECVSGFYLIWSLVALVMATFVLYVVVHADLLLKVQKIDEHLPVKGLGALFVIPIFLSTKSCVLFLSRNWRRFFYILSRGVNEACDELRLYTESTQSCRSTGLARINYSVGVVMIVLIAVFLFVCLPLLLLDLYSWHQPVGAQAGTKEEIPDSSKPIERHAIRLNEDSRCWHVISKLIKAVSGAAEWFGKCCAVDRLGRILHKLKLPPAQKADEDYATLSTGQLIASYGIVRLAGIFVRLHCMLMVRSIGRSLGALIGWRITFNEQPGRKEESPESDSVGAKVRSRCCVSCKRCLKLNWSWKVQHIQGKMVAPLFNVALVTGGLWGEKQWKEFAIEPRANDCYKDEPSGEVKQLQMMELHGKIVSLFWHCMPEMFVVAYLAEVLNRGPILTYFVNKKFLQADVPESERVSHPKWQLVPRSDEREGVVYLSSTSFPGTVLKWGSAATEAISMLYVHHARDQGVWLRIALIASAVVPVLEFLQQACNIWVEFLEAYESLSGPSNDLKKQRFASANGKSSVTPAQSTPSAITTPEHRQTYLDAAIECAQSSAGEKINGEVKSVVDQLAVKKKLVVLEARPEVSYVVLADGLSPGEGELTISWQINARQRFHALDAIGMFPARTHADSSRRSMDQCICYRLVKSNGVQPLGWKLDTSEARSEIAVSRGVKLQEPAAQRAELDDNKLKDTGREGWHDSEYARERQRDHAREVVKGAVGNPVATQALSQWSSAATMNASKAQKIVSGEVKFRPANSGVDCSSPRFESFIYGNDAGIYQPRQGRRVYEFCYLRFNDNDTKLTATSTDKKAASKVRSTGNARAFSSRYHVLDLLPSNAVSVGTSNLFINLSFNRPVIGPEDKLSISWTISGVDYSTLSRSECRNCIGFYRVKCESSSSYAKIEDVPTWAYVKTEDGRPCIGQLEVTAPSEPGMYEVRFLFNFFKSAQLHRQCQAFRRLEDEMRELRARSFYAQRAVTEAYSNLLKFEAGRWRLSQANAYAWTRSVLLCAVHEKVRNSVVESSLEYSEFLASHVKRKFMNALESEQRVFQERLALIVDPFKQPAFMDVLLACLASNSQANDLVAALTLPVPTDEDMKRIKDGTMNTFRRHTLLPTDEEVRKAANLSQSGFWRLARVFLGRDSLCGFHDLIDDLVLTHEQLQTTIDQIMDNVASDCVAMFETPITQALQDIIAAAKEVQLDRALIDVVDALKDQCRAHIHVLVRGLLETNQVCGLRARVSVQETRERLATITADDFSPDRCNEAACIPAVDSLAPVTLQHVAVRHWITSRLMRKVVANFRQRYARMVSKRWVDPSSWSFPVRLRSAVEYQEKPRRAFPLLWTAALDSPLHFLHEARAGREPAVGRADGGDEALDVETEEHVWESTADVADDKQGEDGS